MSVPGDDQMYDDVSAIVEELGVDIITMKVLRKRLEDKYSTTFGESEKARLAKVVERKFEEPKMHKSLQAAFKAKEEGLVKGGTKVTRKSKGPAKTKQPKQVAEADAGEKGPKKAMSGYFFFTNAQRKKITDENPGLKITEVAKKIGDAWKQLSDEEKAPYNKMAEEDKVRYQKEMEEFTASGKTLANKSKGKANGAAPVDPNRPAPPKRPMSGYMIYVNDNRERIKSENPGIKITEITSKAGAEWKDLTADQKKKYEDKAAELKDEYNKAMEEYNAQYGAAPKGVKRAKPDADKPSRPRKAKKRDIIKSDSESASSSASSSSSSSSDSDSDSGSDSDSSSAASDSS